jgi:hypothetical protein
MEFKLVNEYLLSRLGTADKSNRDALTIIETERRCQREMSYGFIHMIWITQFIDGSIVVSVPLNVSTEIKSFLLDNIRKYEIIDDYFISQLKKLADIEAQKSYAKESCRYFSDFIFACNAETVAKPNPNVTTVRLKDKSIECCNDIGFPEHCLPGGIIYGVIDNNKIVSLAHAHKTGEYQDIVADIGVETSKGFWHFSQSKDFR